MQFTIPGDVLKMEHKQSEPLTKEQLIDKYSDVFNLPVESLPGGVHYELDPSVTPEQNSYESSRQSPTGHVSGRGSYYRCYILQMLQSQKDWISKMVMVKKQTS